MTTCLHQVGPFLAGLILGVYLRSDCFHHKHGRGIMYGTSNFEMGGFFTESRLLQVNLDNGSVTTIGTLPQFPDVSLAISPHGKAYVVYVDGPSIQEIDLKTGSGVQPPVSLQFEYDALTYAHGELYGITNIGTSNVLVIIDPVKGTEKILGSLVIDPTINTNNFTGLAYDPHTKKFYGIRLEQNVFASVLYEIDCHTLVATQVGVIDQITFRSLEFAHGVLYAGEAQTAGNTAGLYTLNRETATATLIGDTGVQDLSGLSFY